MHPSTAEQIASMHNRELLGSARQRRLVPARPRGLRAIGRLLIALSRRKRGLRHRAGEPGPALFSLYAPSSQGRFGAGCLGFGPAISTNAIAAVYGLTYISGSPISALTAPPPNLAIPAMGPSCGGAPARRATTESTAAPRTP